MSRSAEERIADIRSAIARCLRYSNDLDEANGHIAQMARDAIERNIAVTGEAAAHLPANVTDELSEIDWSAIRGMRNILIYDYFGVETAVVRDVIDSKLQPLDIALYGYLGQNG